MQNSGKVQLKRTKIDQWLNKIILGVGDEHDDRCLLSIDDIHRLV
jgi:hypothetical protein